MKSIGNRKYFDTLEEVANPAHTAVLVIDQQNDFCHEDGFYAQNLGLDVSMGRAINEPINRLTTAARQHRIPVIFTQFMIKKGFVSDSSLWLSIHANAGLKNLDQEKFYTVEGTWGVELYEAMERRPDDIVIPKFRSSAFLHTPLEAFLHAQGVTSLIITGQVTEGCVENTIRHARDLDFYTILAKDAIASTSMERHNRIMANWLARSYCPDASDLITLWDEKY